MKRVEDYISPKGKKCTRYLCECSCGKQIITLGGVLRSGEKTSCGCKTKSIKKPSPFRKVHIGDVYGRLTVIEEDVNNTLNRKDNQVMWKCKCSCGNITYVDSGHLLQGRTKSCGCLRREITSKNNLKDWTFNKVGLLTPICRVKDHITTGGAKVVMWLCECDCGTYTIVSSNSLNSADVKSCGCIESSYGEYQVNEWLKEHSIRFEREFSFDDLINPETNAKLRFDFAIKDNENNLICLIEYQGIQHYQESKKSRTGFGKLQRETTDALKRDYCSKNNIPLYEIKYNDDTYFELDRIYDKHKNQLVNTVLNSVIKY